MEKRGIIIGSYDTAAQGWTLTGWTLSAAEYRSNFVTVPGRDGDLDLSTVLTDGTPRYGNRTLQATFECSDGTRLEREALMNTMVNWLDGWRVNITLPDDAAHYLTGRVHVIPEYNDLAHAAVAVEVVCDPWRYSIYETAITLTAGETEATAWLQNSGRRTVVPTLVITGEDAEVLLVFGSASWALGAGTYQLPDLVLAQGGAEIKYSGVGVLAFTYREAVL